MAASGENELAPIESRDELVTYIEQGEKPKAQWRIGTEHEKFPFYREGLRPVPYEGPAGIRALLEGMAEKSGWRPIYDLEHVIALEDPTCALGGSITLEPGGQFELSGAPLQTIFQTCEELHKHLKLVREVADPLGISFLGLGSSPLWTRRRNAPDAQEPLRHHDRLHAEGWQPRPRHDVPLVHGAGEPRFRR